MQMQFKYRRSISNFCLCRCNTRLDKYMIQHLMLETSYLLQQQVEQITTCGDFKIHTFTGPGTFTVSLQVMHLGSNTVDYLVVAGGGGGGTVSGGGGGAGGFRESRNISGSYTAIPLGAWSGFTSFSTRLSNYSWRWWSWMHSSVHNRSMESIQFFNNYISRWWRWIRFYLPGGRIHGGSGGGGGSIW